MEKPLYTVVASFMAFFWGTHLQRKIGDELVVAYVLYTGKSIMLPHLSVVLSLLSPKFWREPFPFDPKCYLGFPIMAI